MITATKNMISNRELPFRPVMNWYSLHNNMWLSYIIVTYLSCLYDKHGNRLWNIETFTKKIDGEYVSEFTTSEEPEQSYNIWRGLSNTPVDLYTQTTNWFAEYKAKQMAEDEYRTYTQPNYYWESLPSNLCISTWINKINYGYYLPDSLGQDQAKKVFSDITITTDKGKVGVDWKLSKKRKKKESPIKKYWLLKNYNNYSYDFI